MLLLDKRQIGNKLLSLRKRAGLTQQELADAAGLSDRTYADIERGETNMRVGTLLKLCQTLHVTPNEILTDGDDEAVEPLDELMERLDMCSSKERETALKILKVYFQSLN